MRYPAVFIFSSFILSILPFVNKCGAQSPKLVHAEKVYGSSCYNPDSVLVDTCSSSLTFGKRFAYGPFSIEFAYGSILPLDSVRADSDLWTTWSAIDTSYDSLRSAFSIIEATFGTFKLHKLYPNQGDTAFELSHIFVLYFDVLVRLDSAQQRLNLLPMTKVSWDGGPFGKSWLPNDIAMKPGASMR